jgi:hypothetical protein
VRAGDVLLSINEVDLSGQGVPFQRLVELVRALPDQVTLQLLRPSAGADQYADSR